MIFSVLSKRFMYTFKRLISVVCFLCASFYAFAQEEYKYGLEMGFYTGLSIPLGEFADKNLAAWDDHCGCAKTNGLVGLKARVRLKNNFFGVLGLQSIWNAFDAKPIAKALNTAFDAPFSVETDSWKSRPLQLGVGYGFLITKGNFPRWDISLEASGVLNDLKTYSFLIYSPDGSNRYPLRQKSVGDTGVGYSAAAAVSINWDLLGVKLAVEYLNAFHRVKGADRRFNGGDLVPISYDQKVALLLLQVGITLRAY